MSANYNNPHATFYETFVNTDCDEIFEMFKLLFPYNGQFTKYWIPYGQNTILLKQSNMCDLIFTYNSSSNWKVETVKAYMNDIFA